MHLDWQYVGGNEIEPWNALGMYYKTDDGVNVEFISIEKDPTGRFMSRNGSFRLSDDPVVLEDHLDTLGYSLDATGSLIDGTGELVTDPVAIMRLNIEAHVASGVGDYDSPEPMPAEGFATKEDFEAYLGVSGNASPHP